ncbi:hypothetical protein AVEN_146621-1 [Araneus ventricosus]|uniref:Uncharacterized protein n=1 Tax=Araneus ventricosus TaxID=182803 RepID=A0A4Y2F264_ARAVE|nr:hypothetical protein AVEN_146621-1 [Araneus ventricosus]
MGQFSLVPFSEAARGLFFDGTQNFKPQSDDKDDTRGGTPFPSFLITPPNRHPFPNFLTTPTGGRLVITYEFASNRPIYRANLQWNRVLNLEHFGPRS